jgi:hypothetical protein
MPRTRSDRVGHGRHYFRRVLGWVAWIERYRNPHGVRRIEGAKLFFPEEMPRIIVEEAMALWKMSLLRKKPGRSCWEKSKAENDVAFSANNTFFW